VNKVAVFVFRSRSNSAQHLCLADVTFQLRGHKLLEGGEGVKRGWSVLGIRHIAVDGFGSL